MPTVKSFMRRLALCTSTILAAGCAKAISAASSTPTGPPPTITMDLASAQTALGLGNDRHGLCGGACLLVAREGCRHRETENTGGGGSMEHQSQTLLVRTLPINAETHPTSWAEYHV